MTQNPLGKLNIWKASTLVLAGALVLVVGRGGVAQTQACDTVGDVSFQDNAVARARIKNAIALLNRTQDQLESFEASSQTNRTIQLVSAAVSAAKRDLALRQDTRPRPRPMRSDVIVLGE
jgi:hypothetical protein